MTGAWLIVEWVAWAALVYHLIFMWRVRAKWSQLPKRFGWLPLVGVSLLSATWFTENAVSLRMCFVAALAVLVAGNLILQRGLVQLDREQAAGVVEGIQTLKLS